MEQKLGCVCFVAGVSRFFLDWLYLHAPSNVGLNDATDHKRP